MICAYNELYLERARDVLAVMFDYVVNSLKIEGDQYLQMFADRKSTRLNSSHPTTSRMPSSA